MADSCIYLDHNSTTPIDPRVVEAMVRAWTDCGGNPASQHAPGRKARRMLEEAREGIAELLGAKTGGMDADRMIFTSGGTEANNLAILGLAGKAEDRVLTSAIEHPSIHVTTRERRQLIRNPHADQTSLLDAARRDSAVVARAATDPYASDSDEQLIRQVGEGNAAAIVQFWQRHDDRVVAFIQELVGSRDEAKHLAGRVFCEFILPRELRQIESLFSIARQIVRQHSRLHVLPARRDGVVNIEPLRQAGVDFRLASVMLANNETGVIQPVAEVAALCRQRGTIMHTDAVQAIGKIPVHFRELGVDAMTLAPHKFHGPLGIGALVLRHGVQLQPQLLGGFQQEGLRPGTENVALAVGFHKALELAVSELPQRAGRMHALRDALEQMLGAKFPDMVIIGKDVSRLPNTSCLSFPGLDRQALVMALDMAGVACSTGSACASGSSEPSPVLLAMGLPPAVVEGAIRLSLGAFTTADEVAEAARRILNAVNHLRSRNSG